MLNNLKNLSLSASDFITNFFLLMVILTLLHFFIAVTSFVFTEQIAQWYLIGIFIVAFLMSFKPKG